MARPAAASPRRANPVPVLWAIALIIAGIAIALVVSSFWSAPGRIVYINAPKVIEAYKRTGGVRKELEMRVTAMQANVDTLSVELENEMKRYEKSRPEQTERENQLSLELLRTKREQFLRYQRSTEENIAKESEKVTADLLQEINGLTQAFAKKKGYALVLGASGNGSIIYADDALDISDLVIEAINAE